MIQIKSMNDLPRNVECIGFEGYAETVVTDGRDDEVDRTGAVLVDTPVLLRCDCLSSIIWERKSAISASCRYRNEASSEWNLE